MCQPGAPAGKDIALNNGLSAPAPVSKQRPWTAAEKAFALEMLLICGDNEARTIAWLVDNRYSVYGPSKGQQPGRPPAGAPTGTKAGARAGAGQA